MFHRSVLLWTPRFTNHVGYQYHPGILLGKQPALYAPAATSKSCAINTFHSINIKPHCPRDYIQQSYQIARHAPYPRLHDRGVLISTSTTSIMSSRSRFSKRQRVPSESSDRKFDLKLKVQRTKEMESDKNAAADKKAGSDADQRQGFTQENWPQGVMECQWRRTGRQFKSEHTEGSDRSSSSQTQNPYKWHRDKRPSDHPQHGRALGPPPQSVPTQPPHPSDSGIDPQFPPGAGMSHGSWPQMPCVPPAFFQPSCGFHSSGNTSQASSMSEGECVCYLSESVLIYDCKHLILQT